MTIVNGYATLTQVKSKDALNFETDSTHDTTLEVIIEEASRLIDETTGRHFYSATETRYYTAKNAYLLSVDDIATASGLLIYTDDNGDGTFENTWSTTDYNLAPYNALLDDEVYEFIKTAPSGLYKFPVGVPRGVKITGTFGWPAVPKLITQACILQTIRTFQRNKTALGVAGASATGTITFTMPKLDPDVEQMITKKNKVAF